jgi:hypothetical protein
MAIRSHVTYDPSDCVARVRTSANALGRFDVYLRQPDNAYFLRQYRE